MKFIDFNYIFNYFQKLVLSH